MVEATRRENATAKIHLVKVKNKINDHIKSLECRSRMEKIKTVMFSIRRG